MSLAVIRHFAAFHRLCVLTNFSVLKVMLNLEESSLIITDELSLIWSIRSAPLIFDRA